MLSKEDVAKTLWRIVFYHKFDGHYRYMWPVCEEKWYAIASELHLSLSSLRTI